MARSFPAGLIVLHQQGFAIPLPAVLRLGVFRAPGLGCSGDVRDQALPGMCFTSAASVESWRLCCVLGAEWCLQRLLCDGTRQTEEFGVKGGQERGAGV